MRYVSSHEQTIFKCVLGLPAFIMIDFFPKNKKFQNNIVRPKLLGNKAILAVYNDNVCFIEDYKKYLI